MSAPLSLGQRLIRVLRPTSLQVLFSFAVSAAILLIGQSQQMLQALGIESRAIESTRAEFNDRFDIILHSPIISNMALIVFWATVGLAAYLVWWIAYNFIIEARNEVTIETEYTNRGRRTTEIFRTLLIKLVAGAALIGALSLFKYGLSLWAALFTVFLQSIDLTNAAWALAAVVGLALQLYFTLALVQLTFTPWYRQEAYATESANSEAFKTEDS